MIVTVTWKEVDDRNGPWMERSRAGEGGEAIERLPTAHA